ncbi:MAG: HlyD family efflux transporter periplasmic adaptor subunit [Pseudoflavonifractor sp.]|nr:HlyD family efflux transporter periplasmic adaptor subunit [Alloprevotella sp.]MCM1116215.1 HlyD family efflux transporter periplasmic adaptor subunit [Pseudoflavonifractor sp.]
MDTEIKPRHPKLKKYLLTATISIPLLALALAAALSYGSKSRRISSRGLLIEEVTRGDFNDYLRLPAKVETGQLVQVSAIETGLVDAIWVEEGAMVEAGDIIVTLRNPNLQQQILDSQSQLAERQNMLRDTEIAMEKERLQIKQDLLTARIDLGRKRRAADQQQTLYNENLTSREEYLHAKEDYELARENLSLLQSRQRHDSLYRSVQIAMMRESLHNMQQNFILVSQRADNLNIRASHSGQLGSLNADLGQNITAGQQIGQINILDNYKLTVAIDEHYIDRIAPGLKGVARRQGHNLNVSIRKVYPEVTGGQFRADLTIDDPSPDNLRVGQTYTAEITLGEPTEAILVPKGSFFQSTGGKWVYVIDTNGSTASRRDVKIGRQNPLCYEVVSGLNPGERVITSSYKDFDEADNLIITD